jgi:hypothetical protein
MPFTPKTGSLFHAETQEHPTMQNELNRLAEEIAAFAAAYGYRLERERLGDLPFGALVDAFAKHICGDAQAGHAARELGAKLRQRHKYAAPGETNADAADFRRGLACLAATVLHGEISTDFGGGDRMTAEQVALYVVDDFWPGRDDRPIEEWPDIRGVRVQVILDALSMAADARSDALAFAAEFIERHPALIERSRWGLGALGMNEDYPDAIWTATGDNEVLRAVWYLAEPVLASLGANAVVD